MGELTEQQREFCRLVAKGICGRQAYASAYGCDLASAASSASRMLKRDNIKAEVNRLTAAAREMSRVKDSQAIGDKVDRMEMLWRMARDSEEAGNVSDAVKCVAELNRMDGAYEPEHVQVEAVSLSFDSIMENLAGPKT